MILVIMVIVVILFTICITIILDHNDNKVLLPVENYTDDAKKMFEDRR